MNLRVAGHRRETEVEKCAIHCLHSHASTLRACHAVLRVSPVVINCFSTHACVLWNNTARHHDVYRCFCYYFKCIEFYCLFSYTLLHAIAFITMIGIGSYEPQVEWRMEHEKVDNTLDVHAALN